jgi:nucleotidyltransferase substrate binding protein (TIGR01987 family)
MTPQTPTGRGAAAEKPRWVHRYDSYTRALALLREAVQATRTRDISDLEKQGLIKRFELVCELGWKLQKDYLENAGAAIETSTPSSIVKEAFAVRLIENVDLWMQSLNARNRTSHIYDLKTFEKIMADIFRDYLPLFDALQRKLLSSAPEE